MKKYTTWLLAISLSTCTVPSNFVLVNQGEANIYSQKPVICNGIFKEISENWFKDRKEPCFHYNEKLVNKIKENEMCFIGLTSDQLISLFGEPQRNEKNVVSYYMDKTCERKNLPPLNYVKFYKDWKSSMDTVTSVQIGKIELKE